MINDQNFLMYKIRFCGIFFMYLAKPIVLILAKRCVIYLAKPVVYLAICLVFNFVRLFKIVVV